MTKDQADFVASELRRLAPAAATPEGGTSHDGRRAFIAAAEHLESVLWERPEIPAGAAWDGGVGAKS